MPQCNPAHIPCCISVIFFILSIISAILYLVLTDIKADDNPFGEIAMYTLAVTLLMWIINVIIPKEDKVASTKVRSTKVASTKVQSTKVTPVTI